jgi:hypothetical protein
MVIGFDPNKQIGIHQLPSIEFNAVREVRYINRITFEKIEFSSENTVFGSFVAFENDGIQGDALTQGTMRYRAK